MSDTMGRVGLGVIEVIAAMPRCRDCRWWEPNEPREQRPTWGQCRAASMGSGEPRNFPETRMLAQDAYEYEAWLETAPDFGCVQFEVKPDA